MDWISMAGFTSTRRIPPIGTRSPLLALRQVDDEGLVCGEVWLRPADLPGLIAALTEQLLLNYSAGAQRWRGMPGWAVVESGPSSSWPCSPADLAAEWSALPGFEHGLS
jgi:hypothetical protein